MDKIHVLLAEDEKALAHIVRESLEDQHFEVTLCYDGQQALNNYILKRPDILIMDVMMPRTDGFETVKKIREKDQTIPIIFLTARSQPKDVVAGFESGANDYLKKPFSVEELIVRIKVLLNPNRLLERSKPNRNESFSIGSFTFRPVKNLIERGVDSWQLTSRECDILKLLCQNEHETIQRKTILQNIWGDDSFFNARSLDVFITKLRKRLEADPNVQIINVRGIGYKLVW
ncbi:MAG TPA: response regulator transcription factor [Mucilaginibacter sp.]|nr:response regulator transcription factor [Mucilaginibacter sp.]